MLKLISKYRFGLSLYGILILLGILLVAAIPRLELHLVMNANHSSGLDLFFKTLTWLAFTSISFIC